MNSTAFEYTVIPVVPDEKIPAVQGWMLTGYGVNRYNGRPTGQQGNVCSELSRLVAVDVDKPEQWADSATGRVLGSAVSMRNPANGHWHVYLDARGYTGPWPRQGKTSWGDIKSSGFVRARPAYQPAEPFFMGKLTAGLVAAIDADRVSVPGNGSGRSMPACCADTSRPAWWKDLGDESLPHFYDLWALAGDMRNAGCDIEDYLDEFSRLARDDDPGNPWTDAHAEQYWPEKWKPAADYQMDGGIFEKGAHRVSTPGTVGGDGELPEPPVAPGKRRRLTSAADVTMKPVAWLWEPYIPDGMFTVVAGREGTGKSQLLFAVGVEHVQSRGQSVIVVAPEDPRESVTVPRLKAAGADMRRVYFYDAEPGDSPVTLRTDLEELAGWAAEAGAGLVIFDPIISVFGDDTDENSYKEVSAELQRLAGWADSTGVAVVGITHNRKSDALDSINKVMSSKAFTTKPRSVLMTARDADHPDVFTLTHEKSNVGPLGKSMCYRTEGHDIVPDGQKPIRTSRTVFLTDLEMMALQTATVPADTKFAQCARFVREYIEHMPLRVCRVAEVRAAAVAEGFGADMVRSAELKELAGVSYHRDARKPKLDYWSLSSEARVFNSWERRLVLDGPGLWLLNVSGVNLLGDDE